MGRDVSAFVVGVDGLIQAHEFHGILAVIAHHLAQLPGPVKGRVSLNKLPIKVAHPAEGEQR